MRADLGRNPVNTTRRIERRAGTFVRMAAKTYGATLAVFLVAAEKIQDIAGHRSVPDLRRVVKDIAQNIGSIRLARDKPRAGE